MTQEVKVSDLGPLPWLASFADLGVDGKQPRGPIEKLRESRFLGLDATHRGYAFDPEGKAPSIELGAFFGMDVVTQEYRGIKKRWWQPEPGVYIPSPHSEPVPPPSRDEVKRWLAEWPPRAIMPIPDGELSWWMVGGQRVSPLDEKSLERLCAVRDVVRSLLEATWNLRSQTDGKLLDGYRKILAIYVKLLTTLCTGHHQLPDPGPPPGDVTQLIGAILSGGRDLWDEAWDRWGLKHLTYVLWQNSAPVSVRAAGSLAAPEMQHISSVLPGIVWAELLNFANRPAAWDRLRWCACGRFFAHAPGEQGGRPREFCSDACRRRFHDYGPHDRSR